jgi:hypothetical protein
MEVVARDQRPGYNCVRWPLLTFKREGVVPEEGFEPSVEDPKSPALPLGYSGSPGYFKNAVRRLPGRSAPQQYANGSRVEGECRVTWPNRPAFCLLMRNALLAVILFATAACGAYHFPGPGGGTGTVSGQVTTNMCWPVEAPIRACPYPGAEPAIDCPADPNGIGAACGQRPIPGLQLFFSNGSTTFATKTDSRGFYSIDLPSGTWSVSTRSIMRIISGPQTLVVKAGDTIVADYLVDTGIRTAA